MNMENCEAYQLIETKNLTDINSIGYILKHKKTGAKVCLISNEDANKVFYIGFRTPPADSTGVAHIVEHTVLCGSEKFPVKDPFVELVKGSMNTFLNAMTYPDKTIYPVASVNDVDFQNLMHVYLDAVFHPNIYHREEIFKQEGWHYELEDVHDPISLNGVVYNEMKGAFSSPESVLERQILKALNPDTCYQNDSGGDPKEIPNLTYRDFLDFHSRYYHPSNSYIYLYGNMNMEEKLNWIDQEYLSKYDYLEIDSSISMQEPFTEPVEVKKAYSIASGETLEQNTYLSLNYAVDTILNEKLYIAFDILDYALLGAPGAPLKQALLDAGIGKDVMSSYDNGTLQPTFSIIVKNSDPDKKDAFLQIVEKVLREQAAGGLNKQSIAAGLNSFEFKYREADFGQFPKGLLFGIQCLDSWLYDESRPFVHLEALDVIDWLKQQLDTDYYENLIKTYLLENPHRAVVMIEPEFGLNAREEEERKERLAAYKDSLSEEELVQLVADTKHLKQYQDEPSTQEELLTIPMLSRKDLKREAQGFDNEMFEIGGCKGVFHQVDSNGIAYLDLLFDTSSVGKEDISYLGILKAVLGYVDTEKYGYRELANEINLNTGGISGNIGVYVHSKEDCFLSTFEVRTKVLYEKLPKAMELIGEILAHTDVSDEHRIYEILAQLKSRLQMNLSSAGHSVSAMRAMSYFSKSARYSDLTSGIAFYKLVSHLEEHYEQEKERLAEKLKELITLIFRPENLLVSLGSQEQGKTALQETVPEFLGKLWTNPVIMHEDTLDCIKANEGFMDASQVQYVSRAGNFRKAGYEYTGALRILKVILGYEYLWINIRVKGGAYGCMTGFTRSGDSYFTSYRDPNLQKTNEVYEGCADYLRSFDIDERDMTKYIIGTFSDMDIPLTPSTSARRSLSAYLTGVTKEDVQRERDQVLDATQEDIRALAPLVEAVMAEGALCVIGNEEKLKEQEQMFDSLKNLY